MTFLCKALALVAYFLLLSIPGRAGYTDPAVTLKAVVSGTQSNKPILVLSSSGSVTATLVASPRNFTPTSYTWSQLPATNTSMASSGTISFGATQTSGSQTSATFPAVGVYQVQVVATNGTQSASRYLWLNVWDKTSTLTPLTVVGRNPDVAPPVVRELSPDPGPYCHPRLLFTRSDWPELSGKATTSTEVASAISGLQSALNGNFDSTNGNLKSYATVLQGYAASSYSGTYYQNTVVPARTTLGGGIASGLLAKSPGGSFIDALLAASYLAWIGTDPTLPQASVPAAAKARFQYLATLVGAAAKVELQYSGTTFASDWGSAPKYNDLAVCYDLMYDWMTPQQRNDTRDYLYVIGYGRYNSGYGGMDKTAPNPMPAGGSQNGDFPNLADELILSALVIEGEEADVTGTLQSTYGPTAPYATGPNAWPYASPASVSNLWRQARWDTDWYLTNWGSMLNHSAYFELSMAYAGPAKLALARRGQNLFVTTNFYQSTLGVFYQLAKRQSDSKVVTYEHHEGGMGNGPGSNNGRYVIQYMYPGDPLVDYVHRAFRAEGGNDFAQAVFSSDPSSQNIAAVAQAKGLALTKLDPMRGMAATRNTWSEDDLMVYFEARPDVEGHMHAEANNFSLFALGRAWSTPPGYHCTINDLSATVLIQKPELVSDTATQGFIGQSPSSATQVTTAGNFPMPPAKLLEVKDDPAKQWTLFAGDASSCYNFAMGGGGPQIDTGIKRSTFLYDGVYSQLLKEPQSAFSGNLIVNGTAYNPVQYAMRSLFTVRGSRPYLMVIDDITVDGTTPRNYRWSMPCSISFGGSGGRFIDSNGNSVYSSLVMQSGSTPTDAVVYHSPIDSGTGSGKPRLLVRDVTEQSTAGQPNIFLDNRPATTGVGLSYGIDSITGQPSLLPSNRVIIQRNNVAKPDYKVLLFPYKTGETAPVTSWDAPKNVLTIDLQNTFTDRITFDRSKPDKRTRIAAFSRTKTGRTPPTLTLPSNFLLNANTVAASGQPGVAVNFTVTGTNDLGAAIPVFVSSPSGSVFPVGENVVTVTGTDSIGQVRSSQFTVTVIPSAPNVSVTSITNLPGGTYGLTMQWDAFFGATGYSVKRATSPGGPYTVISDRQAGTTFTDAGLSGTGYYYVVSAWLNSYEGVNSAELPLVLPTAPFTAQTIGTPGQGNGTYQQGDSYLLTVSQGDIGAYSEQCTFLSFPWNGDGSFTARLTSVSAEGGSVSAFSTFGVMMRKNLTNNDVMAASCYNPYVAPLTLKYRSTPGSLGTTSGSFGYVSLPLPKWLRLVRSGTMISAFYSEDGSNWNATADPVGINLPTSTLVGLAIGPQSDTRTSAVFDNLVFLGTPQTAVTPSAVALNWQGSPGLSYTVERGSAVDGPFTPVATALSGTTFSDSAVVTGSTYFYRVSTSGSLGGRTVSPVVAGYFPLPVTAPGNLSTTATTGQITINWTGSAPETAPTYTILRATNPGGPYETVATGVTDTSYVDSGFTNGTTYYYKVVAENGRGTATSGAVSGTGLSGVFQKANNTVALSTGTSWIPSSIPGGLDTVLWTGTYSNGSVAIGSGLSVNQLQVTNPNTVITINSGSGALTIGGGGMDLGVATQNLAVNAPVVLAASQTWNVGTNRTVTVNGNVTESGTGMALVKSGTGTLILAGSNSSWSGTTGVTAGTLQIGNGGDISFFPSANVASVATLRFNTQASGTLAGGFDGGGTLNLNNAAMQLTVLQTSGSRSMGTLSGVSGATCFLVGDPASVTTVTNPLNSGGMNVKFNGGTWILNGGGSYGSNFELNSGTVQRPAGTGNCYNIVSFTVHGGTWISANNFGLRFGTTSGANSASGSNFVGLQDGGTVSVIGSTPELGSASANINASYLFSGGLFAVGNNLGLKLGAATTGTGTTTFTLTGSAKLTNAGTIQGSQAAPAVQVFAFTGGTLATGGYNAANLRSSATAQPGLLEHYAGTLAPGDDGVAGRTVVTGNYTLGSGAQLAIDIGGVTQASGFQTGLYDFLSVSSTASVAGTLNVRLINNYTPASSGTFTFLTATGTLLGTFANVTPGQRITTAGGEGTFLLIQSGNNLRLTQYLNALDTWRLANLGSGTNSGSAANTADPDGDGINNLMEYALGTAPQQRDASGPPKAVVSGSRLQITFLRARSDLRYTVETSNDLVSWTTIATNPGAVGQNVTVTDTVDVPVANPPRRFLVLRVAAQ